MKAIQIKSLSKIVLSVVSHSVFTGLIGLTFFFGISMTPIKTSAQGVSVGFQVFYDELSPYGTWVTNPDYGYVWIPDAGPDFTPYSSNGYWVFTNMGWTWVSDYSWGWAPFHYGRWYTDPFYGPIWVPDYEWGPGWVTWRRSDAFYGWAPIGPGISIEVAYGTGYNIPYNQWTFVPNRNFGRRDIHNYYINNSQNITIINNSTVIHNTRIDHNRNVKYSKGPDRGEVEHRAGRKFTPLAIKETNRPGQKVGNNQLQIYRPKVDRNNTSGSRPVPARVTELKDVKPPAQRGHGTPKQKPYQPPQRQQAQPQKQQAQPQKQQAQPQRQQPQKQQAQPQRQQPQKQQAQPQRQPEQQQKQQAQPQRQQPQKQQAQPQRQQPEKSQPQSPSKNKKEPNNPPKTK